MKSPLQILECEQRLVAAMKAGRADELDGFLHDDLLMNGPTGETATKARDLENYRSGNIRLQRADLSDGTLSMIGDNAIVAVTVRIVGNYLGTEIDGRFRYLRVWKFFENPSADEKAASGWKVIAGSVVPLAAQT